MAKDLKLAV
jgi:ATP-dependent DNA helicase 2 subunit 2